ncbi:PAS domain S-box-containing protein [Chitinivorax tropicus]|uniref:Virulence sensor protein BvgS n=1 Tax=Chitinivorax tropicus TaxID=714531 RepID=A0A840MLA4_9PROT|nr:response regulator [Chitinivorax tropicus]MBB5017492.1 PAS domain S-box-containing protein [Chitinivorax tropicus]
MQQLKHLLPSLLALAIGAAATVIFANYAQQQQAARINTAFQHQVEKFADDLKSQIQMYAHSLDGLRSLFLTNQNPNADEFRRAAMLVTEDQHSIGVVGLGLIRRVSRQDLPSFLEITGAKLGLPIQLKSLSNEAIVRQEHYIVEYAEPMAAHRSSLGLDFRSEVIRRAAVEKATEKGEPAISGPVQMAEGRREIPGIIMVAPVYLSGLAPPTVALRQAEVYGWLYLPINLDVMLEHVIHKDLNALDIAIYDGTKINDRYLIINHDHHDASPTEQHPHGNHLVVAARNQLTHQVQVEVAGRYWTVVATNAEDIETGATHLPNAILTLGAILSLLLGMIVHLVVTGRMRAQRLAESMSQNARTQAERFVLAVEATGEGIFEWIPQTDHLWLAPFWSDRLHCPARELPDHLTTWLAYFPPDEQTRLQALLASLSNPSKNRGECLLRLETCSLSVAALAEHNSDGSVRRIVGSAKDITEKLASEAALIEQERRLQLTIDCAELGIWDWHPHTDQMIVAGHWATMLGYDERRLDQHGQVLRRLIHPDDQAAVEAALQAHFADESAIYTAHFRMLTAPGEWKWVSSIGKVIERDETGSPTRMLGIHVDIDDIKRQEMALEEARQEAEDASRAKSDFLANMSHEIRTPMNAVIGFSNLLSETALTGEQQEYVQSVRVASDALLSLINDILDLSKVESGKLELESIEFDPRQLLESVMGLASERATSKGLELAHLVKPMVPFRLVGDPSRLRQVVLNLVNNAIKFTSKGEVTVRASSDELPNESNRVAFRVEVVDTGIGIPLDVQKKLFKPFSQADASTTRKFGGTGLGLSICQRLIHAMGGTIGLESEEGKGATFYFQIPLPFIDRKIAPLPSADLAGRHCLIIDDNETNRELITLQLADAGMTVEAVSSGDAALARLREQSARFDLAVVDMQMPDMDGLQLGKAIREMPRWAQLPMVMATSMAMHGQGRLAAANGFNSYITKPIRQEQMIECLRLVLNSPGDMPSKELITIRTLAEQAGVAKPFVLLVEDNPVNQRLATLMLQKLNCRIDVASNGEEGLHAAMARQYDLIFMDCQMPVMDGYQATTEIRRLAPPNAVVPIIALTANVFESDRQRCFDVGMNDFLPKPISQTSLEAVVRKWVTAQKQDTLKTSAPPPTTTTPEPVEQPTRDLDDISLDIQSLHGTLEQLSNDLGTSLGEELLVSLRQGLQEGIAQIDAATKAGDPTALRQATHKLKGSTRQLGLTGTANLAEAAEHAVRDGHLDQATTLSRDLSERCQALLENMAQASV